MWGILKKILFLLLVQIITAIQFHAASSRPAKSGTSSRFNPEYDKVILELAHLKKLTLFAPILPGNKLGAPNQTSPVVDITKPFTAEAASFIQRARYFSHEYTELPRDFCDRLAHLNNLQELSFYQTPLDLSHLKELPESLHSLILCLCYITKIPKAIGRSHIERLDLSDNHEIDWKSVVLPDSLKYLNLSNCKLDGVPVPEVLHTAQNVEILNLTANYIDWTTVTHLPPKITDLSLASCNLAEIPDAVLHLPRLSRLVLANNPKLDRAKIIQQVRRARAKLTIIWGGEEETRTASKARLLTKISKHTELTRTSNNTFASFFQDLGHMTREQEK